MIRTRFACKIIYVCLPHPVISIFSDRFFMVKKKQKPFATTYATGNRFNRNYYDIITFVFQFLFFYVCIYVCFLFIYRTVTILVVFGETSTPAVLHPFFRGENELSFRFYTATRTVRSVHIDYFVLFYIDRTIVMEQIYTQFEYRKVNMHVYLYKLYKYVSRNFE